MKKINKKFISLSTILLASTTACVVPMQFIKNTSTTTSFVSNDKHFEIDEKTKYYLDQTTIYSANESLNDSITFVFQSSLGGTIVNGEENRIEFLTKLKIDSLIEVDREGNEIENGFIPKFNKSNFNGEDAINGNEFKLENMYLKVKKDVIERKYLVKYSYNEWNSSNTIKENNIITVPANNNLKKELEFNFNKIEDISIQRDIINENKLTTDKLLKMNNNWEEFFKHFSNIFGYSNLQEFKNAFSKFEFKKSYNNTMLLNVDVRNGYTSSDGKTNYTFSFVPYGNGNSIDKLPEGGETVDKNEQYSSSTKSSTIGWTVSTILILLLVVSVIITLLYFNNKKIKEDKNK